MNSIDPNHKEENHACLMGIEAIEKMRFLIDKSSGLCFFCTSNMMNINYSTPVNVLKSESNGDLWLVCPANTFINIETKQEFELSLFFPETTQSEFLELKGLVNSCDDTNRIKELLDPTINSRFEDGLDYQRFSMHQFTPENGFYWHKKNNILGELLFGKQE